MKRIAAAFLSLFLIFSTIGCGDELLANGIVYETKGPLSSVPRNSCVNYKVITGNVVWGIILIETVIAPIYFFGFSLWEPVSIKPKCISKQTQP